MAKRAKEKPGRASTKHQVEGGSASAVFRVEQLRQDIDSGKTGDKVAYPDPAAAPLGSDDEAAGLAARADENDRRVTQMPESTASGLAQKASAKHDQGRGISSWLIAAAVLIIVLVAAGLALV